MSSAIRALAVKKDSVVQFSKPESPAYYDGNDTVLFPFTCSNQILDITYAGNDFKSRMVNSTGNSPSAETESSIEILGGIYLATTLGENFKAYIRAWRSGSIDAGSPIKVVVAAQLVRVREAAISNITSTSATVWSIRNSAPSGDNYVTGTDANNYQTTFIFKTPLTFSIVESGVTKYITFKTMLDQE